jgi:ABC-2 type transport system permease protein
VAGLAVATLITGSLSIVASLMKSSQGFEMLVNVMVFPMIFLAGVFFPIGTVPVWMRVLSKINPVTYGLDAIRHIFLGTRLAAAGLGVTVFDHSMTVGQEVAIVGALGGILVAGAAWAFGHQQ